MISSMIGVGCKDHLNGERGRIRNEIKRGKYSEGQAKW